nr:RNA-directed DNA polymerase, eukaryota, reverse transcriptase zinc-binding domain protein [Tanacetum cinerariifolium]
MSRSVSWQVLMGRFKARMSGWKANLLSICGRLTLIKSVLGILGIYYLSIFKVPEMVVKSLESLRVAFFWGGHEDTKKIAWVKWSNILAYLDKGGLGVAIHGEEACVNLRGSQTNGVWASIVGTINHLHSSGIVPLNSIRFKVGDGSSIRFGKDTWPITLGRMKTEFDNLILDIASLESDEIVGSDSCIWNLSNDDTFSVNKGRKHIHDLLSSSTCWYKMILKKNTGYWEDCWIEGDSLRNRFPCLYTLESCKRITVGEKMRQPSLEFSFLRNTIGGVEQEQLGDLVTLMHDVSLSPMADRWTWALENSGEFTVSSVRKHNYDKLIPGVGSKTRWI